MGERSATRALLVRRALAHRLSGRGAATGRMDRILVAHRLLLGDTLMLTPLIAKLRANHPAAEIVLLAAPAFVPMYAGRPYGLTVLPFTPFDSGTSRALLEQEPFDLAVVVGDNRYSWLAAAMRARQIVGHDGDSPWTRNWLVDDLRRYDDRPRPWGDMVADLADGSPPPPYARAQWPAPPAAPFSAPRVPYAVLHVGASSALKRWPAARWMELASHLEGLGMAVAWSGDANDAALVHSIDTAGRFTSYAGKLDLAQMWHLLAGAALLVAPDTGIAHLGRVVTTPTVALFGPGSATLCAPGAFWAAAPWRAVGLDPFPCRDQRLLFRRHVDWVRRCARTTEECAEPRCMNAIALADVTTAIDDLLRQKA